jgi:hypothetical protein
MPTYIGPQAVPAMPTGTPVFTAQNDFTANDASFPAANCGFDVPYGFWGHSGQQHYPHPELGTLGPNGFAVRWTGNITPTTTAAYTFYTISDDGVRVWVNGQLIVDNWTVHVQTTNCSDVAAPGTPIAAPAGQCTTIQLNANQAYSLKVEYYENNADGATIQLGWQTPEMSQMAIVPDSALSH